MNEITTIQQEDWYKALIEDCQSAFTEGFFNSRDILIRTYHLAGRRILEETDNFNKASVYGEGITQTLASSMNVSQRTIEYAIKFAKTFPDLSKLPEGKTISMNKIITKYLTKQKEEHTCEFNIPTMICKCGKKQK